MFPESCMCEGDDCTIINNQSVYSEVWLLIYIHMIYIIIVYFYRDVMGRFLNLLKKMQLLLEELGSRLEYLRYSLISEIITCITLRWVILQGIYGYLDCSIQWYNISHTHLAIVLRIIYSFINQSIHLSIYLFTYLLFIDIWDYFCYNSLLLLVYSTKQR